MSNLKKVALFQHPGTICINCGEHTVYLWVQDEGFWIPNELGFYCEPCGKCLKIVLELGE